MVTVRWDIERKDALRCIRILDDEILEVAGFAGLFEMAREVAGDAETDHVLEVRDAAHGGGLLVQMHSIH